MKVCEVNRDCINIELQDDLLVTEIILKFKQNAACNSNRNTNYKKLCLTFQKNIFHHSVYMFDWCHVPNIIHDVTYKVSYCIYEKGKGNWRVTFKVIIKKNISEGKIEKKTQSKTKARKFKTPFWILYLCDKILSHSINKCEASTRRWNARLLFLFHVLQPFILFFPGE